MDTEIVDLGAYLRRKHGLFSDVDMGKAVVVTDRTTGRVDGVLWVREGLGPAEEAGVIESALDRRFPDGL